MEREDGGLEPSTKNTRPDLSPEEASDKPVLRANPQKQLVCTLHTGQNPKGGKKTEELLWAQDVTGEK